jgi:hypothetical protein
MIVKTLPQAANGTGVSDPENILRQLDEVMALPGAQGHHYHVIRQMLIDGLSVEAYSLQQLQGMTSKSATTCKTIRRWIAENFEGRDSALGQDSDPCTHEYSTCVQTLQNYMHGTESDLLIQELIDIGWGQKKGRQVQDPIELVQTHGADRVTQALQKALQPDMKNPAGFITWFLRTNQDVTVEAKPLPKPEAEALQVEVAAQSPHRLPHTDEQLQPILDWLQNEILPQTWQSWFQDCRLTRSGGSVTVWLSNPYSRDWIRDRFAGLIETGVEKISGRRLKLEFEVYG